MENSKFKNCLILYMGRKLADLSREELIEALQTSAEKSIKLEKQIAEILGLCSGGKE